MGAACFETGSSRSIDTAGGVMMHRVKARALSSPPVMRRKSCELELALDDVEDVDVGAEVERRMS